MDPTTHRGDEKNTLIWKGIEPHEPATARRRHIRLVKGLTIITLLFVWWLYYSIPGLLIHGKKDSAAFDNDRKELDFDTIVPSEKLEWHPCYGAYKCARLTVPMDYHRPLNVSKNNPKVHIGLILVPGTHTGTEKASKSPLLLNPGGPGGSGVSFAAIAGTAIQKIVGQDQDVIGFDPRGISTTTPRADCYSFPDDSNSPAYGEEDYVRGHYHRFIWANSGREIGIVNSSSVAMQKLDNRARAVAELCQTKDELYGDDSILKYVNTPNVARDMLSIIDAWDEWTNSLNDKSADLEVPIEFDEEDSCPPNNLYSSKLVYWGFSYGTLLGATFASMFPDRVGRVVLDGVVDADGYVGPIWAESLWDADKVFNSLSTYCHKAAGGCALYRDGDEVKDIEDRIEEVATRLRSQPISWVDERSKMPLSATWSDLRMIEFSTLYSPTLAFPPLAYIFNLLYEGYDDILKQLFGYPGNFDAGPFCGNALPRFSYPDEAQIAVMCSDKRYHLNETIPNLETMFEEMSNISSWSDVWMTLMIGCDAYAVETKDPPMRWDDNPVDKPKPIKTSFPLLFLSNSADPVTPLHAGLKMAKKFVDAGLIEQKSEGHCSLAAASKCTIGKVRAYFAEGKVPPSPVEGGQGRELEDGKWDKCDADEWPFHPFQGDQYEARGEEATAEIESINALKEIQDAFSKMNFWGNAGLEWASVAQNSLADL